MEHRPWMVLGWVLTLAACNTSPGLGAGPSGSSGSAGDDGDTSVDSTAESGSTGEGVVSWCLDGVAQPALDDAGAIVGTYVDSADGRARVWMARNEGSMSALTVFVLDDEDLMQPISSMVRPQGATAVQDVDGDGLPDLVLRDGPEPATYTWLAGLPDSMLETEPRPLTPPWDNGFWVQANGDGRLDFFGFSLFSYPNGIWGLHLYLGDGEGGMTEAGVVDYTSELDAAGLWPAREPGRFVVQFTALALRIATHPVATAIEVTPDGEIVVLAEGHAELDSVEVRAIDDLDGDGIPDLLGVDLDGRPATLSSGGGGRYALEVLGDPVTDLLAGRFRGSDEADLITWDDQQALLIRHEGDAWLPAEPLTVQVEWPPPYPPWTKIHELQADGEGGLEILALESEGYALWRLHPCE